jgi:Cu/Ag efflux protein CusF
MNPRWIISLFAVLGVWYGAPKAEAQRPNQFPLPSQAARYPVTGTVVWVRPGIREIVIDADSIPGYMPAMSMPFAVRDTAVFSRVKPGDNITGEIVVEPGESWLDNVRLLAEAPQVAPGPATAAGPMVDSATAARQMMGRPPKDSIGIKPPPVDSILRPNTMRDSSTLRYPTRR